MRRRIFAEDPHWSLETVPSLSAMCLQNIVMHFQENPVYEALSPAHRDVVHRRLSTSLPLRLMAPLVQDGTYWKRRCQGRWAFCDVSRHGHSWKRMFFERHMAHVLEFFVPGVTDPTDVLDAAALCNDYIQRLSISQLLPPIGRPRRDVEEVEGGEEEGQEEEEAYLELGSEADRDEPCRDHFDFSVLLHRLTNLEELHVVYQVKNCGMNFEWSLFGMTPGDCESFGRALESCRTLKILHVCQSQINDRKCCELVKHLWDHPSLRELDLSYNLIGDKGAKAISQLLNRSSLETLRICNNTIGDQGAKAVARALLMNSSLHTLNLRLNRLRDEGGEALARALLGNGSLSHLHLGANELTGRTAEALGNALLQNNTLKSINLSCNNLGVDGGKALQKAVSNNTTLTECDVRLTEIELESASFIKQVVWSNRSAQQKTKA